MLLAIDIGNTNIVFAVFDGEEIRQTWRVETHGGAYPEIEGFDVDRIIISSVVPDVDDAITEYCSDQFGVAPVFVTNDMVSIAAVIDRPEDIGADRLVNAVAVAAEYDVPAVVVDFGTSTNFDIVDAQGHFCGGVLAPGVNLSMNALHQAASKLPRVSIKKPDAAIGKNTISAMQSGVYWGYMGLIGRILSEIKAEIGDDVRVIATGGLAPLFVQDNPAIDAVDETLTLKGLCLIAKRHV